MPAAALRALLERAIDYAGLFPPAELALEPALRNFAAYLRSHDRWMLGGFVLPIAKFDAASTLLELFSRQHPLEISALGPKTKDAGEFQQALSKVASAISYFSERHPETLQIRQLEMPLPPGPPADSLGKIYDSLGKLPAQTFWEAPADAAPATIAALAGKNVGFKLRTGGVTADAFPRDEQIAAALVAAAREQVPIKFTAGLHHPVKRFHESVGTKMHGFLNVLGAGVLAAEHRWDEAQTAQLLAEEDPSAFTFDDQLFRWRDWKISAQQIRVRRRLVISLGSCSFDEPRADLRALALF